MAKNELQEQELQDQTKNLRKKKVSVGFVVDANSLLEQDVQQEME